MKKIVVFTDKEEAVIERLKAELDKKNKIEELQYIEKNITPLRELAKSISLYPSIISRQKLGGSSRSVETLVNSLCIKDFTEIIFNIPTKAILGYGFSIAKINFFFLLLYFTREIENFDLKKDMLYRIIEDNVFTIMAEDVFLSIISDKEIGIDIRTKAGLLLVNIWENRIYHGVKEFAPILSSIWIARRKMSPSFGTMMGISELFIITGRSDPVLLEFLGRDDLDQEEVNSLMEFLLGLTFEEMEILSLRMEKEGKGSVTKDEIGEMLGNKLVYPEYLHDDPRELYRFYKHRKKIASNRVKKELSGPKKTIEEYIMCFLLARKEER